MPRKRISNSPPPVIDIDEVERELEQEKQDEKEAQEKFERLDHYKLPKNATNTRFYLAMDDEQIGDKFIGMTKLCKVFGISEHEMQKLRKKSWDNAFQFCNDINYKFVNKFWNDNVWCMNAEMNAFYHHSHISPFAHLIECQIFKKQGQSQAKVKTQPPTNIYCMFGIRVKLVEEWKKTGKWRSILMRAGSKKSSGVKEDIYGRYTIYLPNEHRFNYDTYTQVVVTKNPSFLRFKQWCKENDVTIPKGTERAWNELMEREPIKANLNQLAKTKEGRNILGEPELPVEYRRDFQNEKPQQERLSYVFDMQHLFKALEIIERFNRANNTDITISEYINNAIEEKNARTPLIYSNPAAVEQKKQEKRLTQYMKDNK